MKNSVVAFALILLTAPSFAQVAPSQMSAPKKFSRSKASAAVEVTAGAFLAMSELVAFACRDAGSEMMSEFRYANHPAAQAAYRTGQNWKNAGTAGMVLIPVAMVATHYGLKAFDRKVQERIQEVENQHAHSASH